MTKKKLPTLGDMTQEEQDARWENDVYDMPRPTPAQEAEWELRSFESFKKEGLKPEQLNPHVPGLRDRYREFLRAREG